VIRRFYVHNFRCLENFELPVQELPSVLLIGKSGSGKSTIGLALQILQKIGRGTNRVADLVNPKDLAQKGADVPVRFEIEVDLHAKVYRYEIAFEHPSGFKELRVLEEKLVIDGQSFYSRQTAEVHLTKEGQSREVDFRIDWHLVALPLIQERSIYDPLFVFKQWLARMLILQPVPSSITGDSQEETLQPNLHVTNFGDWFSGVLADAPSSYTSIDRFIKQVMPDLADIKNPPSGKDSRSLMVQFSSGGPSLPLPFQDLSDGEKCFMICAVVLAANEAFGPLLCFWDEPENYLHISEVGDFVRALRRAFEFKGQLIATSHNSEAIQGFSNENTLVLSRKSHLEPTNVRPLAEIPIHGDLVAAFARGDLEP
jgi:predicted ATPase